MTERRTNTGVVYVATKDMRYVEEAALSAGSLKRHMPRLPVWLYTDRPGTPLFQVPVFDRVVEIESADGYGDDASGARIDRLTVLTDAPFERCLMLDTDTRVLQPDIVGVFDLLKEVEIALVECQPDASATRRLYGRPMFGGGFILFRREANTTALFEAWRALADKHFRLAAMPDLSGLDTACPYLAHVPAQEDRRALLRRDRLALAQLLSPEINRFQLTYAHLSDRWNHRGVGEFRRLEAPAVVDHRSVYKTTTVEDLLIVAFRRFGSGDQEMAGRIYQHVIAQQAPDLNQAPAAAIAKGFRSQSAPGVPEVGEAAEAILAREPEAPRWLVNAIRMAALHLLAEQPEIALQIGQSIVKRAETTAPS